MAFWDASITIPVSSIPTQSSHKNINKGGGEYHLDTVEN